MVNVETVGQGLQKRYVVKIDAGLDPVSGKRKMIQKVFVTAEQAEEFKKKVESEMEMPSFKENTPKEQSFEHVTFGEFVEGWFYGDYQHQLRPATFKSRRFYMEKQIVPFLGDKLISEITLGDILEFSRQLQERYSRITTNQILQTVSSVFRAAMKYGVITRNPMVSFHFPRVVSGSVPIILNNEEVSRFLSIAEEEKEDVLYRFGIFTGTRLSELLVLTWSDINFEEKTVSLSKILNGEGKPEKIRTGYHQIPIPSNLIEKLKVYKEEQESYKKEMGEEYHHELDLVFPNRKGGFQRPERVRAKLKRLVEKAGLPRVTFSDFRKTYASLLLSSGVNPVVVQRILRLKSIESLNGLLHIFSSTLLQEKEKAIQSMEKEIHTLSNKENKE